MRIRPVFLVAKLRRRAHLTQFAWRLLVLASATALAACSQHHGASTPSGAVAGDAGLGKGTGLADGSTADASTNVPSDAGAASGLEPASLVIHELWTLLGPADEDPFGDRPEDASCSRAGVMAETLGGERVFSVDTGLCSYLTAKQTTLGEVAAGETLKVRLWHFELSAGEPAEAHAAVVVDGLHVLDERVDIPGPGGLLVKEMRVTRAIPAGAPVFFHLHNHGANSWSLVEVTARP
jgi:hypothetical protein